MSKEKHTCKAGDIFKINGHRMRVIQKVKGGWDEYRVYLTCAPQCCTNPFHVKMEMAEKTLFEDFVKEEAL